MKKILIILGLILSMISNVAEAKDLKKMINENITNSHINKGAISISIKEINTGKTVYELNPKTPISPASIQKIVTLTPAFMLLGEDYRFTTKLCKNSSEDYLVVLGADPYLSSKELGKIVKFMPKEPNSVCIDDSIVDDKEWGEGWQWDDDLNPLMPKFGAYNIDKNLMELVISPTKIGVPATIKMSVSYPTTIVNQVITGKTTDYKLTRENHISPDVIVAKGVISSTKSEIFNIPVNSPKKYFKLRLSEEIINHSVSCSGIFPDRKFDKTYTCLTHLSHGIQRAQEDVYKHSNNLVSETVFKIAGGKYAKETGSFENGLDMFYDYCKKNHLDTSCIKLTDASGVSKNNLMISDFMTEFLLKHQCYLEKRLPTAGEGTLSKRFLYLKDNVYAKTGTLNNISSIAGYINTKSNNKYVFCIMINDPKSTSSDKKVLEEYILRTIYTKG